MSSDVTIVFIGVVNHIKYTDEACTEYELRRTPIQKLCRDNRIDHFWCISRNPDNKSITELIGLKLGAYGKEDSAMISLPKSDINYKMESISIALRTCGITGDVGLQIILVEDN